MGENEGSPEVLHGIVECTDTEDLHREPGASQVCRTTPVLTDDPALHVRGRRVEEDVSVVEGVAELIDPWGRPVGTTTFRKWTPPVGQPN